MGKPTEEELELLTDEEREALEFDESSTEDEDAEDVPAPEEAEEDEPEDEEPEAGESEDDESEGGTSDEEPEDDEVPDDEPVEAVAPEGDSVPTVDFVPKPVTSLPDNIKTQIETQAAEINADLQAKLDELKTRYDDGEIDTVEYFDAASGVRDQISANKAEVRDTIRATWQEQEIAKQRWDAEQDAFFKMSPEYDAPVYKEGQLVAGNPILYGALDAACQKISREHPGLSGIDLLIKAKAEVDTLMGRKSEKVTSKRPKAPRPGRNVGDLQPAAAESTVGEFGHLDKLSGDALEDALDKLPAEKRDRYLQGG